jgi:S-adenosylmethionine:diacylglycerol 3-amino-3-carboxypropyl transferase
MLTTLEPVRTPWSAGPLRSGLMRAGPQRLIFGETYEDAEIELSAFAPQNRVFAIAGAGTTTRALAAAGHSVTAVDISAAQIDYAKARAAGGVAQTGAAVKTGAAERLLAWGRTLAVAAGWRRERVEEFLTLEDCAEQVDYWDRWLDTPAWRMAVETLLGPRLLGLWYRSAFVRALPRDFGRLLRGRLRRGWATHANRANPYAALLLQGRTPPEPGPPVATKIEPIRFVCADAAEFLENQAPASFDAFALSNIGDGATPEYMRRLNAAIRRAAAPGALVAMRSFAEPVDGTEENWAAQDRSLLWGVVKVANVPGVVDVVDASRAEKAGGESCCIC